MELEEYDRVYRVEGAHWWYVGMRRILRAVSGRPRAEARAGSVLVDVGCGTGGNLAELGDFGAAVGVDLSERALGHCRERGLRALVRGSACRLPFRSGSADVVFCLDVLYHKEVADDHEALRELHRVAKPGGRVFVRVPAYDWIRGAHDRTVMTRHRYTRKELAKKMRNAGFFVKKATYVNALLFPLVLVKRWLDRAGSSGSDLDRTPPFMGPLFEFCLRCEAVWLRWGGFPFGLSVLAVGEKRDEASGPHE